MRRRRLAATLLAGSIIAASGVALGVGGKNEPRAARQAPPADGPARVHRPALETAPGLRARVRDHVSVRWDRAPAAAASAWSRFRTDGGDGWRAIWDDATGVPNRILGRGIPAPRSVADPAAAERHARAFLARHIDLLAPGAAPGDFVLASNTARRGLRVVGFTQTHAGMPVLGGQVSFRFKNDRLFVIGSEALPHVVVPRALVPRGAPSALASDAARGFARSWVLTDAAAQAEPGEVSGPFVLPLIGAGRVLGYRVVHRVDVAARAPIGRFWVYTDAATGVAVAREQRLRFAEAEVLFDVPVRYPDGGRQPYPARSGNFTIDGAGVISNDAGMVEWAGSAPADLLTRAVGPLVRVVNLAEGEQGASRNFVLEPGSSVTWTGDTDELIDAQLTGFIHARLAKDYARNINPQLTWLDAQLDVNVNIADECNAFSDGDTINFFQSSVKCGNTAQLADVIYHEFGHTLHAHSIVQGVGQFDGAHSEGLSDYLSATITGDPAMGRGFFRSEDPLRHIDPPDYENSWPRDVGEVHLSGLIFAGAMWDLRKLLVAQYGEPEGVALADQLFYATLQRATSIPTTYAEILAEDDDDGDLSNGTPNVCDINAAFGAHGLRGIEAELRPLAAESVEGGVPVTLEVGGFYAQCPGDGLAAARIEWRLRGQDDDAIQQAEMAEGEPGVWTGLIPPVDEGQVVRFKIVVDLLDGSSTVFPENRADTEYEFFAGAVEPLYCTDFSTNPFTEGWTHNQTSGTTAGRPDDWDWGLPMSPVASNDPTAAFSGEEAIGNDLGGSDEDGMYQPDVQVYAQTPIIDTGVYSDVRLQYWRWLSVEDGFFDQATIYGNGRVAWTNLNTDSGDQSNTHHLDREWRFHDVPLSATVQGGKVQVKFEIDSDGGLEFGGWTIDDFCVVAANGAVCGDGELIGAETCDEGSGNSDSEPDACRTNCQMASCGDGVRDSGEACDDGNVSDGDSCSADCSESIGEETDCGCAIDSRDGAAQAGNLVLLALGALLLRRRRRRRS